MITKIKTGWFYHSLDSTYVKAYHRRANARVLLNRHDEACEDFKKVLQYEPKNTVALAELRKLEEIIKGKKVICYN